MWWTDWDSSAENDKGCLAAQPIFNSWLRRPAVLSWRTGQFADQTFVPSSHHLSTSLVYFPSPPSVCWHSEPVTSHTRKTVNSLFSQLCAYNQRQLDIWFGYPNPVSFPLSGKTQIIYFSTFGMLQWEIIWDMHKFSISQTITYVISDLGTLTNESMLCCCHHRSMLSATQKVGGEWKSTINPIFSWLYRCADLPTQQSCLFYILKTNYAVTWWPNQCPHISCCGHGTACLQPFQLHLPYHTEAKAFC